MAQLENNRVQCMMGHGRYELHTFKCAGASSLRTFAFDSISNSNRETQECQEKPNFKQKQKSSKQAVPCLHPYILPSILQA